MIKINLHADMKLLNSKHVIPADDCMDAGGRATHDSRDGGGRATHGAVAEEAKAEACIQGCKPE